MARVDELRALAKKRQRAVNQKISRIRRTSGAEIKGTEFDPRKNISAISKMNSRQLTSYINRLNKFQSRTNQFVHVKDNAPVPVKLWKQYQKVSAAEQANRQILDKIYNNIPIPNAPEGNTIGTQKGQRMQSMKGEGNVPFRNQSDPKNIVSANAVDILVKAADKRSSPNQFRKSIKDYRRRVDKALTEMGENKLREEVDQLSDYQFYAIWTTPGMLEGMFSKYDQIRKSRIGDVEESDDFRTEFEEPMVWARGLEFDEEPF